MKGLKNNKAAGSDGLPAEVFKHGGYLLKRRLHHFITSTWSSGCVTHQSLFFPFIDLTKAFDAVNRDLLWKGLSKFGCPPHFLQILREFHNCMSASYNGHESDPFDVLVSNKQTCSQVLTVRVQVQVQVLASQVQVQVQVLASQVQVQVQVQVLNLRVQVQVKVRDSISQPVFLVISKKNFNCNFNIILVLLMGKN